jgi:hypothetical protein
MKTPSGPAAALNERFAPPRFSAPVRPVVLKT